MPRTTTDRTDDVQGPQIHVVYALPLDGVDRQFDTDGTLERSVRAGNEWLSGQTGGKVLRLDVAQGSLDITFFRDSHTDAEIAAKGAFVRDLLETDLRAAGLDNPNKVYAVYYDGTSSFACGGGAWPPTLKGIVAALYLRGLPTAQNPCDTTPWAPGGRAGYREFSMLHEIMHTFGIVPTCAPHQVLAGHVSDSVNDLMYAGASPWYPTTLDVGRDDYYGTGRADCLDLANSPYLVAAQLPGGGTTTVGSTTTGVGSTTTGGGGGGGGSVPDLKVTVTAKTSAVNMNGTDDIVVTVVNGGGAGSLQTHLSISLPVGLTLVGPPAFDRGSGCTGTQTIDCFLDYVPNGVTTKVLFSIRAGQNGSQSISAVVSADREANPTDNAATLTLDVGTVAVSPTVVPPQSTSQKQQALVGTAHADTITGTARNDVIKGLGGDDTIVGAGGNDYLDGGSGRDVVVGGTGLDRLFGGGGGDTLRARDGQRDTVDCGTGRDIAFVDHGDRVSRNCEIVRR